MPRRVRPRRKSPSNATCARALSAARPACAHARQAPHCASRRKASSPSPCWNGGAIKVVAKRAIYGERADVAQHESFVRHARLRWLKVAVVLDVAAIAAFWWVFIYSGTRLEHAGGTWLGYTLGTIGALIMLWLTMIGVRKRAMTSGNWSLKAWVSAHVYLGLSLVIIVTLHTGFQFGINIHTFAYALMMLVILSGRFVV